MENAAALLAELDALADERTAAVNAAHGDDHTVKLGDLRTIAKRVKVQPDLTRELWATGSSNARLLALLICRPRLYTADELDGMLREARTPKVQDWLVNYVVKKGPHAEQLRQRWFDDPDAAVASAGWALTSERIVRGSAGADASREALDLVGLLDQIEAEMVAAPERLQWAMNQTLAEIGIHHPEHRERALAIGTALGVLKDYPTPPNCTSPYAPIWITEMVRRREG
ncbi:DNA alkylation repair protein [Aestuariimicrobium soli]|uniref:DNA alkylation repair protein n=1 Tax=Aestuariimicrobium soli TaxID=2035834 RepID=UPI003EB6B979